ncbi:MAG: hypothetical protein J6V44_13085 [Methanobrevibacter sp.]|nr:hypothetical protein [Methanobrevibacter sp.]MBO7696795.1 hypothetical protein [Methanobrevibacter sp.]
MFYKERLEKEGYTIENACIKDVSISMADHGVLTYGITLEGYGWGCVYGGRCIGHGYLGAKKFDGCGNGLEAMMRIMDIVGVEKWEYLKGKYIRVASKGLGDTIDIIGNIIDDKWFNQREFFSNPESYGKEDKPLIETED